MSKMSNPETTVYQGKDYTKIIFKPDFSKFGIQNLTSEMVSLFKKRVYDLAGILKCSVFLNEELINVHSFHQYVKMYLKNP
jgi:DNA topoisomerase-2